MRILRAEINSKSFFLYGNPFDLRTNKSFTKKRDRTLNITYCLKLIAPALKSESSVHRFRKYRVGTVRVLSLVSRKALIANEVHSIKDINLFTILNSVVKIMDARCRLRRWMKQQ